MPNTFIGSNTARLIGLDYVLAQLTPVSAYGLAAKQAMQPFLPGAETSLTILFAQQAELLAACQVDDTHLAALRHQLAQLPDWRNALARLEAGVTLSDVDFLGLKQLLYWHVAIKNSMRQLPLPNDVPVLDASFDSLMQLLDPDKTGSPSFYLADSYSPHLASLRCRMRQLRQTLHRYASEQDQALAAQLGLRQLPTGEFRAPKAEAALCQRLAEHPALTVSRTTYTDIYYERQPSRQEQSWAEELAALQAESKVAEVEVRAQLSAQISQHSYVLSALLQALGRLDLLLAKVRLASRWHCTSPQILARETSTSASVCFVEACHPQVAAELAQRAADFQPISWQVASGSTVLTGANMGGKTVALRLIGLLTAMAQYGLLVPAKNYSLTLFRGIRLVTSSYSAATPGLSRFGSEVKALRHILPLTKQPFLLLYDELASGTNPVEGSALAQAIVEYTAEQPSVNIFATHYAELTHLTGVAHWQAIGLSQADPEQLAQAFASGRASLADLPELMDYRLQPVPPGQALPQEALGVARLLGLPAHLIDRASELVHAHKEVSH